ncbi:hypothetical protein ILYODFUR_012684 [Ilyodon furcidens]|uniref:Uncharacterized protein n=1 Tax=Ilyodon furcidens TaxID=33524 RepID=A0ABV0T7H2_9TELE
MGQKINFGLIWSDFLVCVCCGPNMIVANYKRTYDFLSSIAVFLRAVLSTDSPTRAADLCSFSRVTMGLLAVPLNTLLAWPGLSGLGRFAVVPYYFCFWLMN